MTTASSRSWTWQRAWRMTPSMDELGSGREYTRARRDYGERQIEESISMNEAASTISGVVIAMSSSTNSPKVLSTIAEVRGVPASGVHIIDSSKRASEMLKPLLAG